MESSTAHDELVEASAERRKQFESGHSSMVGQIGISGTRGGSPNAASTVGKRIPDTNLNRTWDMENRMEGSSSTTRTFAFP